MSREPGYGLGPGRPAPCPQCGTSDTPVRKRTGGGGGCATLRPMTAQQTQNWWWTAHPAAR
ncbi:trp operon leader peptide [Streptomyces koyangensis]|uniref:Trp operon leader peptide n=1 Tax=Streptomyces koyangensis TaxID=188770 RepID=A0A385DN11_9ACTN|nr:trp operon leader peptide [Streptomyces koyangensis]